MGRWGLGSDENDGTYDRVFTSIMDRVQGGVGIPAELRSDYVKEIVQANTDLDVLKLPGVVIFLLKQGCPVPVDKLRDVREQLEAEDYWWTFPTKGQERKAVIESEISMIDAAIGNGGAVPGPPVGTRGIVDAANDRQKERE